LLLVCLFQVNIFGLAQEEICEFNYVNPNVDWPRLQCYQTCKGQKQSPVDFSDYLPDPSLSALDFTGYGPATDLELSNTGHYIQISFPQNYSAKFDGYSLQRLHFHTPAEHFLKSVQYDMSMHMMHENSVNQKAVVTFLFQKLDVSDNKYLVGVTDNIDKINNANSSTAISIKGFSALFNELRLNNTNGYITYSGSLTTPPCTEGVKWYVMLAVQNLSIGQWNKINQNFGSNARPVQRNLTNASAFIPPNSSWNSQLVWLVWVAIGVIVIVSIVVFILINAESFLVMFNCQTKGFDQTEDNVQIVPLTDPSAFEDNDSE